MSDENEDNELVECDECSQQLGQDDILTTSEGNTVCDDCIRMCEHCEWSGTSDDSWHTVSDELWCEGCWENESVYCDRCDYTYNGDRVATNHINGVDERWCEYCYSDHAVYCEDCDEYYADDDGSCPSCNNSSRTIHQYSYKPNPVFHGVEPNGLYMGFELEMSFGRISTATFNFAATKVLPLQQSNVCYLKSDASIEDMGFELVTHPHTLYSYEQATPLWDFIEDMRANYNARSWDTDSCGLHVHVSRSAFKSGAHTHRFLTLIYKNPKEMMKLAGRKNSRYAQFSDVYQPDEWGIPRFNLRNKIHGKHYTERYSAVNTQNDYTLELRFFRGTMARAGIMSALELTHAATEYTRNLSLADVKLGMLQWEWFASWVEANNGIYPNLYIKMSKIQKVSLENREMLNA
jgi:hypothetical protein